MIEQTREQLEAIRALLDKADRFPHPEQQIGIVILALDKLTDIVERLAQQQQQQTTNYAAMRAFSGAVEDHEA